MNKNPSSKKKKIEHISKSQNQFEPTLSGRLDKVGTGNKYCTFIPLA